MQNSVIGVVGKRGTGKTYLVMHKLIKNGYDIIFYVDYTNTAAIRGFKRFRKKLFRYTLFNAANYNIALSRIKKLPGKRLLVIDDGDILLSRKEFIQAIIYSRNFGYDVIWVAKRIIGIKKEILLNTDLFYFFRIQTPEEIKKVYTVLGVDIKRAISLETGQFLRVEV